MASDEWIARLRGRHDELLVERDDYYGGHAPRGEIAGWVARRLEELVPGERKDSTLKPANRDLVAVWCDIVALYREFDCKTSSDEYRTRIISLLRTFEYPIPTRVVAGVVGCSNGHARRFYWDDEEQNVREKTWSLAQRRRQATPLQVEQILQRDDHRCVRCGADESLIVHHIWPVSQGGTPVAENLVTLCRSCHVVAHDVAMFRGRVQYQSEDEFLTWLASVD